MKKQLSFLLSFFLVLTLILQAVPSIASADNVPVIRVEGENYTSKVGNEITGTKENYLGINRSLLSNGDLLYMKSLSGVPVSNYTVQYQVNVEVSGIYGMEVMSSPISLSSFPLYEMKINDGNYVAVNSTLATKIGQIDTPANVLHKFNLGPVTLQAGGNTITFRIPNGRASDGRIYFYLDYMQFTKLPWGLNKITSNAPNSLFEEQDTKEISIQFTDAASGGHVLDYKVEDYDGNVVLQNSVTMSVYEPSYTVAVSQLQRGHYTITAEADHNGKPIKEYFSVVMNSSERRPAPGNPFAVDAAGGSLIPAAQAANYARAVRLTGVDYVRERMHWNSISSASGSYDFSKYDPYNTAYAANGIRVLELNHIAPTWTKSDDKKLPRNLLDAYQLARKSAEHYGSQSDWEFWNEEDIAYTADSEPADLYAAFLKATTIAARDSGADTRVALGGIAYPPGGYTELLMENDIAPYIDIYNYHGHRSDNGDQKILDLPPSFAAHTEFIQGYDLDTKPIYVTEAGVAQTFTDSTQTLYGEQLRTQARYLTTSTIQSIATGVDKHFWFVFPNYQETIGNYGTFTSRGTPYAAVNAEAAMTHALGEAIYLGKPTGLPEGVAGYVFKDGEDSVVAYWSEHETPLTLSTGTNAAQLTDIIGKEMQLTSSTGSYALTSGPDIHYLRIAGSFQSLSTSFYGTPVPKADELSSADKIVIMQKYPESTAAKAKAKGYLLDKTTASDIQVEVYNFNATPMSGTINGSVYGGWNLSTPSKVVTVAPYSKETLTFTLTGSQNIAADVKFPVVFQGLFSGEPTSKSTTLIASNENKAVTPSLLVPDYDNPAKWEENISPGATATVTQPSPGIIQFDYHFANVGDKWTYPNYYLPSDLSFAGTEGVTFNVYFPAPIDGVVVRSFIYENNGSGYFTGTGITPVGGWQQVKLPWSDFAAFGTPDDNFHLDPDQIQRFSIGINSRTATDVSFKVGEVGVYTQPDIGLYSKIINLVPVNNQQIQSGNVTISADLVQGEIPFAAGTAELLVDGTIVPYQINGQTLTASTVLLPGTHDLKLKAFDAIGRLMSVKSSVTAIAGTPSIPVNTSGGGIQGSPSDDTVQKLTADDLKLMHGSTLLAFVPPGADLVELGSELLGKLNGQGLQLETEMGRLIIPQTVLQALFGKEHAYTSIRIGVKGLGDYTPAQLSGLSGTQAQWGGSLTSISKPLELTLHTVTSSGEQVSVHSFAAPVTLTFNTDHLPNPDVAGIYYWNAGTGAPEYVRSTYDANKHTITASLNHFSTYSLLGYSKNYSDVTKNHWAYPAVRGLTAAHVVNGDSADLFVPERSVTRAEFVTLVIRALGLEPVKRDSASAIGAGFHDVAASAYYAEAVAIAQQAGIVTGKEEGLFVPEAKITREEMAVMLMRGLTYTGRQVTQLEDSAQRPPFLDQHAISKWALQDMQQAALAGLLSGYEDGSVRPLGFATRAEAIQMLWKLTKEGIPVIK
ncbi:S-layer homology domain-containing protein [Paenibacillus oryzisoli]|uniref:SLH domain-containing protein n=1 Tax=Paenibacillus oryzisoli TaxID=1850517 RepID=A0A198AJJ1_9BACL|nr:S-layer homology domain-containing protein [Paenibacillus oryzisoli]OAS21221.1 hypothetical protein A8708_30535 [Paenibacillus oryzisoli]